MKKSLKSIIFIAILSIGTLFSQEKKNEIQLMRFYNDNDFLNLRGEGTDRGYSNGLKLDIYYTKNVKAKFPSNLLLKISDSVNNLYGWGITQQMYTPVDIKRKDIVIGDRPYAGVLYFSHTLISSDSKNKQKLTTTLNFGTIGKYAFAKEVQTAVHGLINYQKPLGWDNQIKSDIIINYGISYERRLFMPSPNLEILGEISGNAGTLTNNIGLGLQFRAGLFNNYFSNYERPTFKDKKTGELKMSNYQFFIYMKTNGISVMDDATLQGGFFTHDSNDYVIKKDDVSRFYTQYEYGIIFANKRFGIGISEKIRTPDFKGSFAQQVGNLTLYIGL
jgi:lipid A 3-O-deacylase